MKTSFLAIFAIGMTGLAGIAFAEEIKIPLGETVSYENLDLSFYDIEDSRCPSDVSCAWDGNVFARMQTSNQTHKMGVALEIGFPFTYLTPYTITLIDVKPHPISTEKPNYVAILDVSKIEKNTEANYVDFRDAKGEIIEAGCSVGLKPYPDNSFEKEMLLFLQCNPFLMLTLMVVMIVCIAIGFVVWRNKK